MALESNSRREFLKLGSAALSATAVSWNAKSYAAIVGANDCVRTAVIGCGERMKGALIPAFLQNAKEQNFELAAVSDIWSLRCGCVEPRRRCLRRRIHVGKGTIASFNGEPLRVALPSTIKNCCGASCGVSKGSAR
jgi:hypothetical protein